jgi:hypothetical protein
MGCRTFGMEGHLYIMADQKADLPQSTTFRHSASRRAIKKDGPEEYLPAPSNRLKRFLASVGSGG